MKKAELRAESIADLLALYEKSAIEHRRASNSIAANKAADVVAAVYRELRRRGEQALLLPLVRSPRPEVRSWAAAHALEFAPEQGVPVLEDLSNEPRSLGFSAKMTLKVWREGNLRFP
jgi:hypothetical protein